MYGASEQVYENIETGELFTKPQIGEGVPDPLSKTIIIRKEILEPIEEACGYKWSGCRSQSNGDKCLLNVHCFQDKKFVSW